MSFFTKMLAKLAGTAVGGWVKSNALWIGVGAAVAALLSVVIYVHGAEKAKAQIPVLKDRIEAQAKIYDAKLKQAGERLKVSRAELGSCIVINRKNAVEADQQRKRAVLAASRLLEAEKRAAKDVGVIQHESESFRGRDLDCPALDDSFREWVRDQ